MLINVVFALVFLPWFLLISAVNVLYSESELFYIVNLNCTFEHNFCAWSNLKRDDQRDWSLNRGKTRTSRTGPSVDHTTNSTRGRYSITLD